MKKFRALSILMVICLICFMCVPVYANMGFKVDTTKKGEIRKLKVLNAPDSTESGGEGIIDIGHVSQASTSGAEAAFKMTQADVDEAMVNFVCTEGAATAGKSNCASCYTSTNGNKVGAIRVEVNGTEKFMRLYDAPN